MSKEKITRTINRREFIKNTAIVSGGMALLPGMLAGCSDDDDSIVYTGEFGFREGVASFDPTATSVILWTRYTSAANESGDATIRWEVSESSSFSPVAKSGNVTATAASDYTVNVDATGLASNKKYFYRFRSDRTNVESVVGETRTLPTMGQATSVKLAVVSCANYQAGLFNVYGAVAESAADVVVHLGDYIYEYAAGGYGATPAVAALNRGHLPDKEILTLDDYRTRYKQYRSDKQLQKAHQLKPFICVWDDHEIANNTYKDGAENHQASEGSFEQRKQFAIQVWHEFLPARVTDKAKIYRSFDFGGLVNLMMLDTRLVGRDKQLSLNDYFVSPAAFTTALQSSSRSLLGAEQKTWLTGNLGSSGAKWQVLGSQVLMGKMNIPTELLLLVAGLANPANTPAQLATLLSQYATKATELAAIKVRILTNQAVTPAERARVENVLPYNLDAWDGYPAEREA
ncbi:MAG: alkaline phosphatase D family protein, partial [Hymenobacter sp.]|nr:alkaline phosphatase D family protein [Hymenobacter sp.]